LSPLYQLLYSALPRTIVGTLGTIKVLLPSYPVNTVVSSTPRLSGIRTFVVIGTDCMLLTDFVCLYNYEFWLSLCKIVRSSVIFLLPLLCMIWQVTSLPNLIEFILFSASPRDANEFHIKLQCKLLKVLLPSNPVNTDVSHTPRLSGILTIVVIGTHCICGYISIYHTITTVPIIVLV
jgi:hypothetical protein